MKTESITEAVIAQLHEELEIIEQDLTNYSDEVTQRTPPDQAQTLCTIGRTLIEIADLLRQIANK